ncbi:LytR family transcriptional regulator [Alkaliphilus pronyensis]|uniref:LytR family transcriptional regulator n=1 Tax=Alkaliphilus pronyensis TaxID=1482732 RepID=A0A6I0F213_9FIRM|nr:LCP family protein [Alkaliphilus pronyensis]KAB3535312.1 LytR family transcriptional regulator [Alkaliphilus pronyensis]
MKGFILKGLAFVLACIALAFISGFVSFMLTSDGVDHDDSLKRDTIKEANQLIKETAVNNESTQQHINFIIAGIDKGENDTLAFATYDRKNQRLDLVFIPRDTYYRFKGGKKANVDKIQDVYDSMKVDGLIHAVKDIMGDIEINNHIVTDYKGFINIIDSIGGVEITIKDRMYYNDPYQKPPLIIDFQPGTYNLNGTDSLKYIRYIKGNKSNFASRGDDIGRIKETQVFIGKALDKAFTYKLPTVLTTAFKYLTTDFTAKDIAVIGISLVGIKSENINFHIIPGNMTPENYYVIDKQQLENLKNDIYGANNENQ